MPPVASSPFIPDDQYALIQILMPTCGRNGHGGVFGRMSSGYAAFLKGADRAAVAAESRKATAFAAQNA